MAFKCTVATPEGMLFDNSATSVVVPAHDGQVGFLTGHAPILVKLGAGPLTIEAGTSQTVYFISGGVAQFKDDVLTVLTDEAIAIEKLDVEGARKELAELTAATATTSGNADYTSRTRRVNRARAVLRVAGAQA